MGSGSGMALKSLQWFIRGLQFCCAAIILGIFAYFLATLHNHGFHIGTWVMAVTGIAALAIIYTALALLTLCCLAGHPVTAGLAILLDVCFLGSFIYLAYANRWGAGRCRGRVNTPFGSGNAASHVSDNGHGGFTKLPTFRQACQMETACLAVAIVGIFLFILSILTEILLARHRRKQKRYAASPADDYAAGTTTKRRGLFGRRKQDRSVAAGQNPNALPAHSTPGDMRDSYATEQTRVGGSRGTDTAGAHKYNKYGESGYEQPADTGLMGNGYHGNNPVAPAQAQHTAPLHNPVGTTQNPVGTTQYPTGNYQYGDGVYNARA